ncbi:hypothetical protein GCG54_00014980 [Colletotrichum gloeosporioides]|uniref:L-tryptophan decarboxylase PsiD-like domain-containing protein n=1 Tax=Colletotrichum gloeosporioides TaxID=474922 RepID=A0A8H4CDN9_COLGL|nr:uncharacterized protein GCG54_00014980 [Colletotrichum gloeosporioides]KAF3801762.1 hypothetical protein GCG54_00014980 [Colletotrichum gloeosporioides]
MKSVLVDSALRLKGASEIERKDYRGTRFLRAAFTIYDGASFLVPGGGAEIRHIEELIQALNYQIQNPIRYNDSPQIGTPINAILDWPMSTKAEFAAFIRDDVNQVFKHMLVYWGQFLTTRKSVDPVTTAEGGWLAPVAQTQEAGLKNFLDTCLSRPERPHSLRLHFMGPILHSRLQDRPLAARVPA